MHTYEAILEPFGANRLAAIRTAFQASWEELCQREPHADLFLRNRLVGAIANLAQSGIDDPDELRRGALQRLRLGSVTEGLDPDAAITGLQVGSYPTSGIGAMRGAVQL